MFSIKVNRTPPTPVVLPRLQRSFVSTAEAARSIGCSKRAMSRHLNGHKGHVHGFQFYRIEDLIKRGTVISR
jgi:hypothetical protein